MTIEKFKEKFEEIINYGSINNKTDVLFLVDDMEDLVDEVRNDGIDEE
jgi:hypothetical protein